MDFVNNLIGSIGVSWPLSLLTAYLGGLASCLTPCVYPLIPITISYITSKGLEGQQQSRLRAFKISTLYVIGLALVYAGLGLVAAFTGSFFGIVNTHPFTYLTVGILLTLMALAMLDIISVPIPHFFSSFAIDSSSSEASSSLQSSIAKECLAPLAMGAASGFVVGPCTAPVLAALLGYVAMRGNPLFGFLLLFTFSLGLGTLLILLGTFSSLLITIPKSGLWMVRIKTTLGLIMLVTADYFIYRTGIAW